MNSMKKSVIMLLIVALPVSARACSESEHAAVFLFGTVWPVFSAEVEVMAIHEVGPATFPDHEAVYLHIMEACDWCNPAQSPGTAVGDIWPWTSSSGTTLVDRRDGQVLFGGNELWMGTGAVWEPQASTHAWTAVAGEPAGAPVAVQEVVRYWSHPDLFPSTLEYTEDALGTLRALDVLHSFAECGDYTVTGYVTTPTIGGLDENVARLVVIVQGRVGSPWSDHGVATEQRSWGSLKALYR